MAGTIDTRATEHTRRRYDRTARFYDHMGSGRMEDWRRLAWERVQGPRVLEVGVGTGKSMPYYPVAADMTAVDLSPRMLAKARERARRDGTAVELREADAQALPFPDSSFETVIATCVLCSVPDPILGLREMRRVLVPGGQLVTLDHVLSHGRVLGPLMRLANPMVARVSGANIDRETVENVRKAGFADVQVRDLWLDIVKLIEARAPRAAPE